LAIHLNVVRLWCRWLYSVQHWLHDRAARVMRFRLTAQRIEVWCYVKLIRRVISMQLVLNILATCDQFVASSFAVFQASVWETKNKRI